MPCHLSAYTACATRTGAFSISKLPVNCTIFYPTNYRASNVNLELTARAPEAITKYPRNAPSLFRRFSRRPHELIKSLSTVSNRPESSRNDHSVPQKDCRVENGTSVAPYTRTPWSEKFISPQHRERYKTGLTRNSFT